LETSFKCLRIHDGGGYSDNYTPRAPSSPSTPNTLRTVDSDDTSTNEVGGIIQPIERKAVKRKVTAVAEDLMVEMMTKELSILGPTKVKDSEMFTRYVIAQETKEQVAKLVVQLRDYIGHSKKENEYKN